MVTINITHKHTLDSFPLPWTLENKIEIFYERFWGWQLNVADTMINGKVDPDSGERLIEPIPNSDLATLTVCFSYFEMIAKYEAGYLGKKSAKLFRAGVASVFPVINEWDPSKKDNLLDKFYDAIRCGLYHAGMLRPDVAFGDGDFCVAHSPDWTHMVVNPRRFPAELLKHLRCYRDRLLDPAQTDLRTNFERRFDVSVKGGASRIRNRSLEHECGDAP